MKGRIGITRLDVFGVGFDLANLTTLTRLVWLLDVGQNYLRRASLSRSTFDINSFIRSQRAFVFVKQNNFIFVSHSGHP